MRCQYVDQPPDSSPCYSTATHRATQTRSGYTFSTFVCADHALIVRADGWDVWPIAETVRDSG